MLDAFFFVLMNVISAVAIVKRNFYFGRESLRQLKLYNITLMRL